MEYIKALLVTLKHGVDDFNYSREEISREIELIIKSID